MIDYIIGRIAGKYNPGNPLAYRSRYKQTNSSFARSDSKAFSFPSDAKAYIAHDSSQLNSSGVLPRNKEHAPDQQPNTNSVQSSTTPIREPIPKFEAIQKLARTLYDPQNAEARLKKLYIAIIENGGKEEVLDRCFEDLKNKVNMKEAHRQLFCAPIKEDNKRPPLHGHNVQHLAESSRFKLTKIEQIQKIRLKNDVAVHEEIERIIKVLNSTREPIILDLELDRLTRGTPQTNN
jgi:hypothetical protein